MPKIVYVLPSGARRSFDIAAGLSVMRGAIDHQVPGIVAECGGACACATCKVTVSPEWMRRLTPAEAMEEAMLEGAGPGVRLSCQIEVSTALDGLVVEVPASQY
jgi:ferredoxin, 2Fe-2S